MHHSSRTIPAAVGLLGLLILPACGGERVREVSLAQLRAQPEHFQGALVRSCGRVRGVPDPEHYWLEDASFNRVGLPTQEKVVDAAGQGDPVAVVGRFEYRRDSGRHLRDIQIEAGACPGH